MSVDLERLEVEAKLQIRVARAILRQRLDMAGNVLLTTWLLCLIMLVIWFLLCPVVHAQTLSSTFISPFLRITPEYLAKLNALAMTIWKMTSYLLFLMPGLALKICASAMAKG